MKKVLIAAIVAALLVMALPATVSAGEIHVHPGDNIQDAIDAASDGDTILVYPGTYTENVYVWKPLNIMSKEIHAAIVDGRGGGWGSNTFTVIASDVTIDGFTIYGPDQVHNNDAGVMIGGLFPGDVYHLQVEHVTVRNCIIYAHNYPGGPEFDIGSWVGIYIWKSSHNMIVNNKILGTFQDGIEIYDGTWDHQIVYVPDVSPAPGSDAGCKFPHPCSRHWREEHGALQTWDGVQLYPDDYEVISPSRGNKIINNYVRPGQKGFFVGTWPWGDYGAGKPLEHLMTDNAGTKVHGNDFGDSGIMTGFSYGSKVFSGNRAAWCLVYPSDATSDYKFPGKSNHCTVYIW